MSRPSVKVPSYRLHRSSGQAVVTLRTPSGGRRDYYLGPYGSEESRAEYARLVAELVAAAPAGGFVTCNETRAADLTVNELLVLFLRWADGHYRTPDGKPTSEVKEVKRSVGPLKDLYGHTPAREFGPRGFAAVRTAMVGRGWCRTLVNRRADRVRRVFRWATAEELVPVSVYQALRTVPGLRRGRTDARESEPVKPVDPAAVAATLPHVRPPVRAMAEVQLYTGMRPGEVCRLRLAEVDTAGEHWLYRPAEHKTAHRGKDRVIPIGPKARAVLVAFLVGDRPPPAGFDRVDPADRSARLIAADAYEEAGRPADAAVLRAEGRPFVQVAGCVVDPAAAVFNPRADREERFRAMRARRRSKVQPSQEARRKARPGRVPAEEYNPHAYAQAVRKGCEKGGVPHWHPNQLRHTFATEVRRRFGVEAAQVLLGHQRADVTQVYAERDLALALRVAAEVG